MASIWKEAACASVESEPCLVSELNIKHQLDQFLIDHDRYWTVSVTMSH